AAAEVQAHARSAGCRTSSPRSSGGWRCTDDHGCRVRRADKISFVYSAIETDVHEWIKCVPDEHSIFEILRNMSRLQYKYGARSVQCTAVVVQETETATCMENKYVEML
ncbi:unnamed protein product, partial [Ectocarpus sp. 13 AM-2016]